MNQNQENQGSEVEETRKHSLDQITIVKNYSKKESI